MVTHIAPEKKVIYRGVSNGSNFFSYRDKVEQEIAKSIVSLGNKTKLRDACEYALTNGGKRFRPLIVLMVAEALEKRLPFRRVLKQTLEKVIASKEVKGAKIKLSGRLGGAEMARREDLKKGQIPLQTLRADIDFAREKAHMTYGDIGIKVWIYKGLIFEKDIKNIKN